jgi:hypothetical protein
MIRSPAMRMLRTSCLLVLTLATVASVGALAGCGHPKALIPVDSPLMTWSPPEDQAPAQTTPAPAPAKQESKQDAGKPSAK